MTVPVALEPAHPLELTFARIVAAPRAAVWRCWTEPDLLKQWYCPKPWFVSDAALDVRAGGAQFITMRGPNGEKNDWPGVYLEVVPGERLVMTDAFVRAWVPSPKPFMVADIHFADHPGGTLYTARVGHFSEKGHADHLAMGFHDGWGAAAEQLEELAASLG